MWNENVWTVLKNYVKKKNPRTNAALIETIHESQHEITLIRRNLTNATPKRLQVYLGRNGEFVHI